MNDPLHQELKKEFQLERMIFFSDAVFAIAITLMVLEIKIPDFHENVSDKALLQALGHLIPKFLGFVISFMLIGLYWTVHHRMFGFVTNYNRRLLWLNLFFLFFIVLMPFSTGFYGEYSGSELFTKQLKVPMTFYVLNFCCVGFINYFTWIYITNPKNKLIEQAIDPAVIKQAKLRALVVPIIFFMMLPVAYVFNVMAAVYVPMLIPLILRIMRRKQNKNKKSLST